MGEFTNPAALKALAKRMGMPEGVVVDELPPHPVSAKALFAQLREMGVGCETCKNGSHSGYVYSFCGETDWLGEDFLCGKWEPTSRPEG